jgi:HD-GYP domain-containing protein (c-di-GMP phosphodiesterase class II)
MTSPRTNEETRDVIRLLVAVIDAADPYTRGRSKRIAESCAAVGRRLDLDESRLADLELAALLHDIGRVVIHREILDKPALLSAREHATVQTHPEVAFQLIKKLPSLGRVAEIVRCHHEQPNGKGYPRGLDATAIPLESAIVMVASAYDALVSDRPYRPGLPLKDAEAELRRCRGSMFDTSVVDAFVAELHAGSIETPAPIEGAGAESGEATERAA